MFYFTGFSKKSPDLKKSPESWLSKIKKLSQIIQQKLLQFAVNNGAKLDFEKVQNENEVLVASFEKGEKLIKFLINICFLGNFVVHGSTILWKRCQMKKSNCAEKIASNLTGLYCAKKLFAPIFRAFSSWDWRIFSIFSIVILTKF